MFMCIVFFFKQKTAYEMRIIDWSSDVCSSDLIGRIARLQRRRVKGEIEHRQAEVDSDVDGATRALGGDALRCQRDALDQAEPRDQRPRQSPFAGDAVIEALPDPAKQSAEHRGNGHFEQRARRRPPAPGMKSRASLIAAGTGTIVEPDA